MLITGLSPRFASAQDPPVVEVAADSTEELVSRSWPSPAGAFLRSVLIPGWGQSSVGAYNRAGFFFTVDATAAWMFFKTKRTLASAEEVVHLVEASVTAQLVADGTTDPQEIASALDDDEQVMDARDLVSTRSQQREDWLAFGLFMLLIGGADAFVAGHLTDFPDPLTAEFRVTPEGGFEAGFSVKLPYHE